MRTETLRPFVHAADEPLPAGLLVEAQLHEDVVHPLEDRAVEGVVHHRQRRPRRRRSRRQDLLRRGGQKSEKSVERIDAGWREGKIFIDVKHWSC